MYPHTHPQTSPPLSPPHLPVTPSPRPVALSPLYKLFILDIFLNFRTGYMLEDGTEESGGRKIALMYLQTFFIIDVVSSIPVDRIVEWSSGGGGDTGNLESIQGAKALKASKVLKVSRVLKLSKLTRLLKSNQWMERMEDHMTIGRNQIKLVKLLVLTLAIAHINACIWAWCSRISEVLYESSWQLKYGALDVHWSSEYM